MCSVELTTYPQLYFEAACILIAGMFRKPNSLLKQIYLISSTAHWFSQMTPPFAFFFFPISTSLWWIFTLHASPHAANTSPWVRTFFSKHSPCVWLLDFPLLRRLLKLTSAPLHQRRTMTPSRWQGQTIFLGIYVFWVFFPRQGLESCTCGIIYSKTSTFQQDLTSFFNDVVFFYTFCGKEKHFTWWHHGWCEGLMRLLSNVNCPVLQRPIFYLSSYAVLYWQRGPDGTALLLLCPGLVKGNIYLALLFEYALRNVFLWNKIIQLKADGLSPPPLRESKLLKWNIKPWPSASYCNSGGHFRGLCSECRRERVGKEGTFTQSEGTCLFVISMMHCASQKGTTVRHKYFGTLDFASSSQFHGQRDNVAFRFGI